MRSPDDTKPDPPGGRAAERLKEFLEKRAPAGISPSEQDDLIDTGTTDEDETDPPTTSSPKTNR